MLSCDEFLGRLYGEDVRAALEGRSMVPEAMAQHRAACIACANAWDEAAQDLHALPLLMAEAAPESVARRVHARLAQRYPTPLASNWSQAVVWAAVGAAASATLLPALGEVARVDVLTAWGPAAWAMVGAALALAASVTRDALAEARD